MYDYVCSCSPPVTAREYCRGMYPSSCKYALHNYNHCDMNVCNCNADMGTSLTERIYSGMNTSLVYTLV